MIASWLLMPTPALAAYFLNGLENWWLFGVLSLGLGLAAFLSKRVSQSTREFVLSFCFVGHCVLFTSALNGHPWQIDAHMLFFAALAIVSTVGSPAALIFATVLVATHHLSFSLLLPSLVYPGGTPLENIERTAIHAAIVVLETGCLLMSQMQRRAADRELASKQEEAEAQAEAAAQAEAKATASQRAATEVVETLGDHLGDLAEGKLDCEINTQFSEEYETLRQNFNTTVNALKDTIMQVMDVTHGINNGAGEITRASDDLSHRTESQAATLEETAAALEEMTTSVRAAADSARSVENSMGEARTEAETSSDIVNDSVTAMKAIEESSVKISQIIGVIDDIAFQTNLLALNAGVEAARAGEAGRGFAVVASEVRGLAQRSADAATEIKTLIGDSSRQVETGVDLVSKAGTAIQKIVEQVNHISGLMSGIAEGAAEQANGLHEINTGVSELDRVTQQNAAMVEESTAAGHMLNSDAEKLAGLVTRFQLTSNGGSQGGYSAQDDVFNAA